MFLENILTCNRVTLAYILLEKHFFPVGASF
jgi:hypothetical protein